MKEGNRKLKEVRTCSWYTRTARFGCVKAVLWSLALDAGDQLKAIGTLLFLLT